MIVAQYTGIGLQKDPKAFVIYNPTTGLYEDSTASGNENIQTNSRARYKPSYATSHIKTSNDGYIQIVSVFAIDTLHTSFLKVVVINLLPTLTQTSVV